jgi:hypothetical protein
MSVTSTLIGSIVICVCVFASAVVASLWHIHSERERKSVCVTTSWIGRDIETKALRSCPNANEQSVIVTNPPTKHTARNRLLSRRSLRGVVADGGRSGWRRRRGRCDRGRHLRVGRRCDRRLAKRIDDGQRGLQIAETDSKSERR